MISIPQGQREAAARTIKAALKQIADAGRTRGECNATIREIRFCQLLGCADDSAESRIASWQATANMADTTIQRWEQFIGDMVDHFMIGDLAD